MPRPRGHAAGIGDDRPDVPPGRPLIFTHVPKTAGSALISGLLRPVFGEKEVPQVNSFHRAALAFARRNTRTMTGHFPYGIHLLAGRPADYLIVLRDPIERSLSFFEFVTGDRSGHPLRQVAENGGLAGLHQNPILRNLQTQFAAGWIGERRNIGIPHRLEDAVLTRAKRNLERRYAWVGFVETFDRSTQVLAGQFDWPLPPIGNFNKNLNRRSAGDLDHDDLRALREANELDRRLYDWAFERFGR